jgi:ribosomal protein S17
MPTSLWVWQRNSEETNIRTVTIENEWKQMIDIWEREQKRKNHGNGHMEELFKVDSGDCH